MDTTKSLTQMVDACYTRMLKMVLNISEFKVKLRTVREHPKGQLENEEEVTEYRKSCSTTFRADLASSSTVGAPTRTHQMRETEKDIH